MMETNQSLLNRLKRPDAHGPWRQFYEAYWGVIIRYARKRGLSEAQAEDVLQETMVALMLLLPNFVYDSSRGRFRNYLLTIVHRKSLAAWRRAQRERGERWEDHEDKAPGASPPFDPVTDAEAEHRWREALWEEALVRLHDDPGIDARTLEIFDAYVLARRPVAEVAEQFGVRENAVFQIKHRLLHRLQDDIALLMENSGGPDLLSKRAR